MTDYAEVPYESLPVPESHPARLEALGWLFGLSPVDHRHCRVLELGCASGGNLIPMAAYLPDSRLLGVDLYANQVADGSALIEAAGLGNVALCQGDIAALDPAALGTFDYVICHGVYSWVPDAVRARILALCDAVLAPGGIAYVSYNTLPGWRMRGMLRDMLGHAAQGLDSARDRLAAVHAFFDRMERALTGLDALSARYLLAEIRRLRPRPPGYLVHEFLEPENRALLFSEFVAAAAGAALTHVCDTDLATRYPELVGDAVAAALADVRDPVEREQQLDFVVNRNFRRSLLCRSDVRPSAEPRLDRLEEMEFASDLAAPRKLDLRRPRSAPFARRDGTTVDVAHPLTKAAVVRLGQRYPGSISYGELLTVARHEVRAAGGGSLADEAHHLLAELYSLMVLGAVEPLRRPRAAPPAPGHRPATSPLARAQLAAGQRTLATRQHTALAVDPFAADLLARFDGTRDVGEVASAMLREVVEGRMAVEGTAPARGEERVRQVVLGNVQRLVALFTSAGVLWAENGAEQ
jgi:SAM-dependent methyltransferase